MADVESPDQKERFELFYRENYSRVYAYVARRAPADVIADLVAETFVVAWRKTTEVPPDPLPWLMAVARRLLANQRRAYRRQEALVKRVATMELRLDESLVEGGELSPWIEALNVLTPRDRELLELLAWEELSLKQAAAVLGASPVACRVRLHRARRRFKRELERLTGLQQPRRSYGINQT